MNTDPLDDRIRGLVRDAVSAAPVAPELPVASPITAPHRARVWVWAGIGLAAAAAMVGIVVVAGRDDPSITAASTTAPASTVPTVPWPTGTAVIVAAEYGIDRVTDEAGSAVVTRLVSGQPVQRAFELEDGSLVYQAVGGGIVRRDTAGATTTLVPAEAGMLLQDADMPAGGLRLLYTSASTDPSSASRLTAWFQPGEPQSTELPGGFGVGYRRFSIVDDRTVTATTLDDTGQRGSYTWTFGDGPAAEEEAGTGGPDFQRAGDGAGTVGVLGLQFVTSGVRSGLTATVADPSTVEELDFRGAMVAVTRFDGTMELVDLTTDTTTPVPVAAGRASVSRSVATEPEPTPTTVANATTVAPTTTSLLSPSGVPPVVTSGSFGVVEQTADGEVVWTTEPMAFAVKAPDGSMIMQRHAGIGEGRGWGFGDTLPLRQPSPGAPLIDLFGELFPGGEVVPGWWTLHDALTIFERPLLLLDRQSVEQAGLETPNGALVIVDLAAGSIEDIAEFGGWEWGSSRLHLAENGLIVGEDYAGAGRGLFAITVGGDDPAIEAADELGLEPEYFDCSDCPRLYTVSHDGSTIAWLDGTVLKRHSLEGRIDTPDIDLGEVALSASNLDLGPGYVVIDRASPDPLASPPSPVVLRFDPAAAGPVEAAELALATRAAIP